VNANFGFILYLSTFLGRANPDNLSKKPQFDVMVHDLFCSFFIRKKNKSCLYLCNVFVFKVPGVFWIEGQTTSFLFL